MEHYILTDTGEIRPADSLEQWAEWFGANPDAISEHDQVAAAVRQCEAPEGGAR